MDIAQTFVGEQKHIADRHGGPSARAISSQGRVSCLGSRKRVRTRRISGMHGVKLLRMVARQPSHFGHVGKCFLGADAAREPFATGDASRPRGSSLHWRMAIQAAVAMAQFMDGGAGQEQV